MAVIYLLETDSQLGAAAKKYFKNKHDVYHFTDPQMAVSSADAHRPDVIVIDLFLAGRSGIEFLYELRSYPDWQALPVIVTGHLLPSDLDEFAVALSDLKIYNYLPK